MNQAEPQLGPNIQRVSGTGTLHQHKFVDIGLFVLAPHSGRVLVHLQQSQGHLLHDAVLGSVSHVDNAVDQIASQAEVIVAHVFLVWDAFAAEVRLEIVQSVSQLVHQTSESRTFVLAIFYVKTSLIKLSFQPILFSHREVKLLHQGWVVFKDNFLVSSQRSFNILVNIEFRCFDMRRSVSTGILEAELQLSDELSTRESNLLDAHVGLVLVSQVGEFSL